MLWLASVYSKVLKNFLPTYVCLDFFRDDKILQVRIASLKSKLLKKLYMSTLPRSKVQQSLKVHTASALIV
jgi:hypothetical protein